MILPDLALSVFSNRFSSDAISGSSLLVANREKNGSSMRRRARCSAWSTVSSEEPAQINGCIGCQSNLTFKADTLDKLGILVRLVNESADINCIVEGHITNRQLIWCDANNRT